MNGYQSVWEDDETNRQIELHVHYSVDGEQVTINEITPTKITFLNGETKTAIKSIGVYTDTGRAIVCRQFEEAVGEDSLRDEIANHHLAIMRA